MSQDDLRSSNLVNTKLAGEEEIGRPSNFDNQALQYRLFNHCLKKLRKLIKRVSNDLQQRSESMQTSFLKVGDESWLRKKGRRFASRQIFYPKKYRKASTVARQKLNHSLKNHRKQDLLLMDTTARWRVLLRIYFHE